MKFDIYLLKKGNVIQDKLPKLGLKVKEEFGRKETGIKIRLKEKKFPKNN